MSFTRRTFMACLVAFPAVSALAGPALAEKVTIYAPVGLALQGYDPVAYFTEKRALRGKDAFMLKWRGAIWAFVSAENLMAFEMNPSAYAPQYGGYCAYGVSQGQATPGDPEAWSLFEGRLYLNSNSATRDLWETDRPGFIAQAEVNWPRLSGR